MSTKEKDKEVVSRFDVAKARFIRAICEMEKDIVWLEEELTSRRKNKKVSQK